MQIYVFLTIYIDGISLASWEWQSGLGCSVISSTWMFIGSIGCISMLFSHHFAPSSWLVSTGYCPSHRRGRVHSAKIPPELTNLFSLLNLLSYYRGGNLIVITGLGIRELLLLCLARWRDCSSPYLPTQSSRADSLLQHGYIDLPSFFMDFQWGWLPNCILFYQTLLKVWRIPHPFVQMPHSSWCTTHQIASKLHPFRAIPSHSS